jgi:uncharacterized membrane protein
MRRNARDRAQLSATVQYVAHAALYMATAFFLLAGTALLFLSPNSVSRGIYFVVLGLNALVIVGAVLLMRFMRRSDAKLAREKKAERKGPGIEEWLERHEGGEGGAGAPPQTPPKG